MLKNAKGIEVCSDQSRFSNMADLWRSEQLCDAEVVASDGTRFPAHRLVLASMSDYMRALLAEDRFKDSSGCPIQLPDVSSSALKLLLEWMYDGVCFVPRDDLSVSVALIQAAHRIQCNDLVANLENSLVKSVEERTCLEMWDLASTLELETLAKSSREVALAKFVGIIESDGFTELASDRLADLLSDSNLGAGKENEVFKSIIKWANGQKEALNAEEFDKVLAHVRFPLIDKSFFEDFVEKDPLLTKHPIFFRTIAQSFYKEGHKQKRLGIRCRWEDLKAGLKVRIIDDVKEFERLCDNIAPGAEDRAGWGLGMENFCGDEFLLTDKIIESKDDTLKSIEYGHDSYFVPYNALFVVE